MHTCVMAHIKTTANDWNCEVSRNKWHFVEVHFTYNLLIASKRFPIPLCTWLQVFFLYLSQLHLLHVYRLMGNNYTLYEATYRLLTPWCPFSKLFKMCALDIGTPMRWFTWKPACRCDACVAVAMWKSGRFQEVLLLFLVMGLLSITSSSWSLSQSLSNMAPLQPT